MYIYVIFTSTGTGIGRGYHTFGYIVENHPDMTYIFERDVEHNTIKGIICIIT